MDAVFNEFSPEDSQMTTLAPVRHLTFKEAKQMELDVLRTPVIDGAPFTEPVFRTRLMEVLRDIFEADSTLDYHQVP